METNKFNNLAERLNYLRDAKASAENRKITWNEIAKVAGVSTAAVSLWLKNSNGIKSEPSRQLGKYFGVNSIWIETGEGEIGLDSSSAQTILDEETQLIMQLMTLTDKRGRSKNNETHQLLWNSY